MYAVDRIAYEQAVVDVFLHLGILQAYQLLLVAVIREVHPQVEVLRFHGDGREAYLPAAVAGVADVRPRPVEARSIGQHLEVEQVVALRIVIVDRAVDTSLEEPEVEADVEHLVALPLQVGRRAGFGFQPRAVQLTAVEIGVFAVQRTCRGIGRDRVIARHAVRGAQLEVRNPLHVLEEGLFRNAPRDGPRREEGPFMPRRELRRTVLAERRGDDVPVVVGVLHAPDDRNHLAADEARGQAFRIGQAPHVVPQVGGRFLVFARHRGIDRLAVLHFIDGRQVDIVPAELTFVVEHVVPDPVGLAVVVHGGHVALVGIRYRAVVVVIAARREGGAVCEVGIEREPLRQVDLGEEAQEEFPLLGLVLIYVVALVHVGVLHERVAEGVDVVAAVLVAGLCERGHVQELVEHVRLVVLDDVVCAARKSYLEERQHLVREICGQVKVVVPRVFVAAVFVLVVECDFVGAFVRCRRNGQRVACPQAFLVEILSHPVIVDLAHVGQFDPEKRLCVVGFAVPGACRAARLALECDVFVGVHYVERTPVVDACTHEPVVGYRRLALFGLFGRNQDNAVGAAGAVDGRRGRVFQHVDRLDVPGVDRGQRFVVGNAVEDDQRVVAGIARAGAAYADRTPVHPNPGDAGQRRGDVVGRNTLDTVCRDRADGTCDVLAFHRGIARHDDIFQTNHILRQDYVHRSASGSHLDGLRQHAEERYFQQVAVFHPLECVVSRVVGQRAA